MSEADAGVIATNDDATQCKLSAVALGYWKDEFIAVFGGGMAPARRPPLINRGYFSRTHTVLSLAQGFAAQFGDQAQVVNLGAGYDTLFFRLTKAGARLRWFDVDLPEVVHRKQALMRQSRGISTVLKGVAPGAYNLVAGDLRAVPDLDSALRAAGLDPTRPTLLLAECVLVYLDDDVTRGLLTWASATFPTSVFFNYGPINPSDAFGKMMVHNLELRGCPLRGLPLCPDLVAQTERLRACGFQHARALDMNAVYARLPAAERARIERLEPLDEFEEWSLINAHYCMSWGWQTRADAVDVLEPLVLAP